MAGGGQKAALRARAARDASLRLRAGETMCATYSVHAAACHCLATHLYAGIGVMPVGRGRETDRCLRCGCTWKRKGYDWQPSVVVAPGDRRRARARGRRAADAAGQLRPVTPNQEVCRA